MSPDFSYSPPDTAKYFKAILLTLKMKGHLDLHNLLKNAQCSIDVSSSYSRSRWDALHTTIIFRLPMSIYEKLDLEDEGSIDKRALIRVCDDLMPPETGLDVMNVGFAPQLDTIGEIKTLEDDLEEIAESLHAAAADFALPADIVEKGHQMAEVYLYLYAVENYLRLFVDKACTLIYGGEYFKKLAIPRGIANSIDLRKKQEEKNQWVSIRGNSDLFYLDFKDLGTLVQNNWDIFKAYFPDQSWISSKIDELSNCRNLVAHNSFIGEHERDVIRVNFNSILRQLNPYIK